MDGTDEAFEYGKEAFEKIKHILHELIKKEKEGEYKGHADFIIQDIWGKFANPTSVNLSRLEVLQFFNDFIANHENLLEGDESEDDHVDVLTDGLVFD